jgi:hypothetical protein
LGVCLARSRFYCSLRGREGKRPKTSSVAASVCRPPQVLGSHLSWSLFEAERVRKVLTDRTAEMKSGMQILLLQPDWTTQIRLPLQTPWLRG